ncbi:Ig-like domain-containing protein [Bacteroidota bacterium]
MDKIPPEIIEVYPEIGTTNFSDDYFEITFSEYVDKRSVKDAIFISPAIEGELEFDWSGKSLEVSWEVTLRANTTYTVSVGSDVVDHNNRNRMAETFNLIFSTGNEIDKGMISGKVYDEKPAGVMVFAYRKSDSLFNPSEVKPDFISQVGEKGDYKLIGLADGDYRILAVRDEFRDFLYNVEQDQFGSPFTDVKLTDIDSTFVNLNFFLAIEDTTQPHLQSAVMTDRNHILVEFNENIDSTLLSTDNFSVVDSTTNTEYLPKYFFKGQSIWFSTDS